MPRAYTSCFRHCIRIKTLVLLLLVLSALFVVPISGQSAPYCEGEGCPTRYLIEGFEVWMSPSLEDNPAYADEYLDRYLDVIQAQLLYMDSVGVIPQEAMNALRDSGLTIYIDDPDNQQEWWPCAPGPGGCYASSMHRIGGSFWGNAGNVLNGWHWQSFILHEVAHAYHHEIVVDGYGNLFACVKFGISERVSGFFAELAISHFACRQVYWSGFGEEIVFEEELMMAVVYWFDVCGNCFAKRRNCSVMLDPQWRLSVILVDLLGHPL